MHASNSAPCHRQQIRPRCTASDKRMEGKRRTQVYVGTVACLLKVALSLQEKKKNSTFFNALERFADSETLIKPWCFEKCGREDGEGEEGHMTFLPATSMSCKSFWCARIPCSGDFCNELANQIKKAGNP